jgi:hypothetical protein
LLDFKSSRVLVQFLQQSLLSASAGLLVIHRV